MKAQFVKKQKKMLKGFLNTYFYKKGKQSSGKWWDESFYTSEISDSATISPGRDALASMYHYKSIEMQIVKHLFNNKVDVGGASVLDLGSGAGHWIDFYRTLGAKEIQGLDISKNSFEFLTGKYAADESITVHHGRAVSVLPTVQSGFDIVNAIGVMFHITDDAEWAQTIKEVSGKLKPKGLFIVGGHFGMVTNLNVQIRKGEINKRLRSKGQWKNALRKAGFKTVKIYRNYAYLFLNHHLPESNILVAIKDG